MPPGRAWVNRGEGFLVDKSPLAGEDGSVAVTWSPSADQHGIDRDEALYAMAHADWVVREFGRPRAGDLAPTLFIGPSRYGTLEVLAELTPPDRIWVFHVMRLRESTRLAAGYEKWS
jgi:hypothetical protein